MIHATKLFLREYTKLNNKLDPREYWECQCGFNCEIEGRNIQNPHVLTSDLFNNNKHNKKITCPDAIKYLKDNGK